MKKLKFILILLLPVLFFSCKKDDPAELILGTWKATYLNSTNCTDATDNANYTFNNGCTSISQSGFTIELCEQITFNTGGSYTIEVKTVFLGQSDSETTTGTYTISGSTLKLCESGGSCDEASFDVSDKELVLNSTDSDTGCKTVTKFGK